MNDMHSVPKNWTIDKKIPVAVILVLLANFAALVYGAAVLKTKQETLEVAQVRAESRMEKQEAAMGEVLKTMYEMRATMQVMDARMAVVSEQVKRK